MRTIIVDDEILARKRISNLLNQMKGVEIIAECNNGISAISDINALQPDLIFLDINIRDMNGFEVLEKISCQKKPYVIFVTAHDNFAVKAFDFEAFDYLVKPFKEERFFKTVNKVLSQNLAQNNKAYQTNLQKLIDNFKPTEDFYLQKCAIKQGNKTILIDTVKINYIISSGVYAEIFTNEGAYLHRESLNNLEKMLHPKHFHRVHRSAIVNLAAVKEIVHNDYSEIILRMKDLKLISVSKASKKAFLIKLGI